MGKRKIKFEKGEFYHVYNRGCGRSKIFRSRENFLFFERRMREYSATMSVSLIAYTLMHNHYHLVVRQDGGTPVGTFAKHLFLSYSKAFNKWHSRTGTLFEGPFQCAHVNSQSYLLTLCRYVHRNPLEAGLVTSVEEWEFSDYRRWIHPASGQTSPAVLLAPAYFSTDSDYESFVISCEPPRWMSGEGSDFWD